MDLTNIMRCLDKLQYIGIIGYLDFELDILLQNEGQAFNLIHAALNNLHFLISFLKLTLFQLWISRPVFDLLIQINFSATFQFVGSGPLFWS